MLVKKLIESYEVFFSKKPFLKTKNILFGIESHNTLHHEDFTPFLINANAYG